MTAIFLVFRIVISGSGARSPGPSRQCRPPAANGAGEEPSRCWLLRPSGCRDKPSYRGVWRRTVGWCAEALAVLVLASGENQSIPFFAGTRSDDRPPRSTSVRWQYVGSAVWARTPGRGAAGVYPDKPECPRPRRLADAGRGQRADVRRSPGGGPRSTKAT
jgi:hypothetical protein